VAEPDRPNYGIDAPGVVRNLFLAAAAGLLVGVSGLLDLWPGEALNPTLACMGLACALSFTATGLAMLWYSKFGKLRARERLLDQIAWRGDEEVLDVGCGRGLMLVGAAKRLATGKATGIDVWQGEDLSGNRPEATLENARREGVLPRVQVQTADMRRLPFADGSFDIVVSCAAIHNLYHRQDREQAIREIARVLKPDGQVLIADVRHLNEYAEDLEKHGCGDCQRLEAAWKRILATLITWGAVRPGTLLARKESED
jgi:SAM-dependent methyltransferase